MLGAVNTTSLFAQLMVNISCNELTYSMVEPKLSLLGRIRVVGLFELTWIK
jgi:hypothetical protein